uniref:Sodium channel protein n=1 Tax=Callorhinchus milii TaxID=7868 RepID=A0A4W3JYE7_CALMI
MIPLYLIWSVHPVLKGRSFYNSIYKPYQKQNSLGRLSRSGSNYGERKVSQSFGYLFTFIYTVEVIIKVLARVSLSCSFLSVLFCEMYFSVSTGLKTIIGAIFKSARLLMEVLLLMLFVLLIIALFGLQIFKGVLKHKCIKNLANGINITDEEWYTYIQNQSSDSTYDIQYLMSVLYNTFVYRRCPTNFTCLPGIGHNPNNGYTNFDNIGWALITAFQLITLDYWENTYNLVLRASGAYYIIFFIVVVMFGAHYIVNLVLAVVAASYEKEAKRKQEAKEEEERILELRRKKEKMVRSSTTQKTLLNKFRLYGKRLSMGFSVESVASWATEISQFSEFSFIYLHIIHSYLRFGICHICGCLWKSIMIEFDISRKHCPHKLIKHKASQSNNFSVVLTSLFLADEDGERQTKTTSKWNMFKRRLTKKFCSWTCCPAFLNIQHYLVIFVSHSLFEGVITICILINTLLLSIDYYKAPYSNALEKGNTVLSIIFVIEAILKITALNPLPYVQNGWNAFDFIIVLLSCLEWALSTINIPTLKLSMIRSLRMLRVFKLAKNWRTLNILITIIFKSMREMGNLTVIVIIVIYIFTVIGMQLVGHDYEAFSGNEIPRWNFTGFYNSFIMVFRILCGEWIEPLYDCMRCSKMYFCVPLFLLTYIAGNFLVLNLFLALLLNFFSGDTLTANATDEEPSEMKQMFKNVLLVLTCRKSQIPFSGKIQPEDKNNSSDAGNAPLADCSTGPPKCTTSKSIVSYISEVQQEMETETQGKNNPQTSKCDDKDVISIEDEANEEKINKNKIMDPCFPVICTEKCNCCDALTATFVGKVFLAVRNLMFTVVNNRVFDAAVLFVILLSTVTLIQLALQNLDYFYTVFFNMEMVFKVLGLGLTNYFTNVWTLLDFFLVVVSTCFFILAIQAFKSLRSLRTLRALRPLRAISRWEGMRLVVNALVASIPSISNVMLVCLVFWLIFGIVGVQIFGGMFFRCVDENDERLPITIINNRSDCDAYKDIGYQWVNSEINFDNILTAYMALLQVATFEGWLEIMANAADTRGIDFQPEMGANPYSLFYFVAFIVIGTFFTLNLFIGIIIDNFNTMHKRVKGALVTLLTEDQRRFYSTFKRLSQAKPTKKIPAPKVCFDNLVSHKGFEPCTIGLITLNVLVMACDHYGQTKTFATVLNWFNIIFTALFTLEAVVKLSGQRLYYFTQAWNIFDFIVVILSIAGILLDSTASKKQAVSPTILRVFRIVRLARLLRLVRSLKGIRKLLFTLVISIPALFNIGLLLGLVMFIYAILGMNLFRDLTREPPINDIVNFETFGNSMMLLFRLTTAAAWNEVLQVMVHSKEQRPFVAIIYMTSYILCANIVIINMYVAVILENFHEAQEQEISGVTDEDVDMFYEVWSNFDPNATQFITYEQLPDFLHELKHPLQIPKPNAVKIAALNFPLVDGHKLHCLDVLKSLSSVVIGNIVETEPLKKLSEKTLTKAMKLFPIRSTMRTTTTTLMIRKEIKAALTIQKAFRKWQVRQCYKAAKKKHERSYSSLKRSLGSLRSSRPNSPLR